MFKKLSLRKWHGYQSVQVLVAIQGHCRKWLKFHINFRGKTRKTTVPFFAFVEVIKYV